MLGLARFALCLAFCMAAGYVIAEGHLLPEMFKAKLYTPVGIGCSVTAILLCASALYWFLEAAAVEAAARHQAWLSHQEDALMGAAFQFRVAVISSGQDRAAEVDFDRRVHRVVRANNGAPMPNRGQIGSATYGV